MKSSSRILFLIGLGIIPLSGFAQDNAGNTTTTDNGSTSSNTTATTSGNVTLPTPDAIAAIQQQQQQLTQQFTQQLQSATPDDRLALIADFRSQLNNLLAPLQPPSLTQDQQAQLQTQQAAAQQAFIQSLPADAQATAVAMQQRQQLVGQLANATSDQKLTLIAQIQQLATEQDQAQNAQIAASANGTAASTAAQAQVAWLATLPPDQQVVVQAQVQRQQAIQAAMQLSPDDRVAALQAIQAQTVLLPGANTTTGSTSVTGNSSSTSKSDSTSSTNPPSQP